jgi:hypothetical protein
MLFIIELIFLGAGLWMAISGKPPQRALRLLFGKGEYVMAPTSARLYGLLLATPLPAAFLAALLVGVLAPAQPGLAIGFEIFYALVIVVIALIVARRTRRPETKPNEEAVPASSPPASRSRSDGSRLLIISTLVMLLGSYAAFGGSSTGDFVQDVLPWIVLVAVSGLGAFGIVSLIRLLRKSAE